VYGVHIALRTTNLLERLFGEERRRPKVIPRAFGERAVVTLMFAAHSGGRTLAQDRNACR
jgi:hypothetical protein